MATLGFGYSLWHDDRGVYERKFYAFRVFGMNREQFEDLDQNPENPDGAEWFDVFNEGGAIATTECCDIFSTDKTPESVILWADYNVSTTDEKLIRGVEIMRNYFISKGMRCSAIKKYTKY